MHTENRMMHTDESRGSIRNAQAIAVSIGF